MDPKTLFAILGLLIVLCILCSCLGALRELNVEIPELGIGDEETISTPAWGKSLNSMLQRRLEPEEVETARPLNCLEQFRRGAFELAQENSCTLTIEATYAPVRTLSLHLTEGHLARVTVDPNEEDKPTVRRTLGDEHDEFEAQIFKEGGAIEVRCLEGPGGDCRLEIQ